MKNKFLVSFLLCSALLYGANILGETPPAPDGTKFFSESTLSSTPDDGIVSNVDKNTNLIGEDTLPTENINKGLHYTENFGLESNGTNVIDNMGRSNFVRSDGTTDQNMSSQVGSDDSYKAWKSGYDSYFKDTNSTTKRANEGDSKRNAMTETYRKGNTINDLSTMFFKGKNVSSGGQTTTQSFRSNINNQSAPSVLKETEDNATKLYRDNYSQTVNKADKENIVNEKNYGALTKAFNNIEVIKEELTNRLTGATIKCQISRELIPSYKCPIPGKDGAMYPGAPDMGDIRKVNILEAKAQCNNDCWSDPGELSCVNKKILTSDIVAHNFPSSGMILFPGWTDSTTMFTIPTSVEMPVKDINFSIELKNVEDSNKTDEEWQSYLEEADFKFQYSILETFDPASGLPDATIVDRAIITIRSSEMNINVPIDRLVYGLKIKFWKPYIASSYFNDYKYQHYFDDLTNWGAKIKITNFDSKYSSDSHYFCQAMQMVASPNQCIGGEVVQFTTGDDQFNYLCNADSRKIGPEPVFGAFYDQDSCEYKCVEHKECVPTYRHYNSYGDETFMYKAKISCVDDPENNHCAQSVCEAFFANEEERPLNEMVVANDDTFIYTVKNKALQNYPRPKIDLGHELGTSTNYEQTFQNEQKDAAYLSMLDNMSFNKIRYKIGENSPFNMAYIKEEGPDRSMYSIDLKPESFQFDDGKTYYLYSVIKLFHSYTPVAGAWHLNGSNVTATETNIQFADYSYIIKNSETVGDWKVFRREQFSKYLVDYIQYTLNEDGQLVAEHIIDWVSTNQYKIQNFELYNNADNSWSVFAPTQQATYFKTQEFKSVKDYYRFLITDWIERDIYEVPGFLIKDQVPVNHETSFEKLYNTSASHYNKSNVKNYTMYLVYSETKLTYDQLMKEIEGSTYTSVKVEPHLSKWGAFDYLTKIKFRSNNVRHDQEINNNISSIIMGTPNNTSVSVDWTPAISEKGKKVFKFLFLYDENEYNPFIYSNDNGADLGQLQN